MARNLITDYSFVGGTRQLTLTKIPNLKIENIRLIVNETQKVVLCSSMQKANVESITYPEEGGSVITFIDSLPPFHIEEGVPDQITVEVDMGGEIVFVAKGDLVIAKKTSSLNAQEEPWILTNDYGQEMKQLAESNVLGNYITHKLAYLFCGSNCTKADLSALERIEGESAFEGFAQNSKLLEEVDLSNLKYVSGRRALWNAFKECTALRVVKMGNLLSLSGENISGDNMTNGTFLGCSSLNSIDLHSLQSTEGQGGLYYFFGNCSALYEVDLSNWQNSNGSCAYFFYGCTSLRVLKIGVGVLDTNNYANNPLYGYNLFITDLFLSGTPTGNIYIQQLPLNFTSVLRVLEHIANDPNSAMGKTLSFNSGLNFTVTQEELDAYNAAKTTVQSTFGWTIQNAPNVHL